MRLETAHKKAPTSSRWSWRRVFSFLQHTPARLFIDLVRVCRTILEDKNRRWLLLWSDSFLLFEVWMLRFGIFWWAGAAIISLCALCCVGFAATQKWMSRCIQTTVRASWRAGSAKVTPTGFPFLSIGSNKQEGSFERSHGCEPWHGTNWSWHNWDACQFSNEAGCPLGLGTSREKQIAKFLRWCSCCWPHQMFLWQQWRVVLLLPQTMMSWRGHDVNREVAKCTSKVYGIRQTMYSTFY